MYQMTMVISENDKATMEEFMRQMNITADMQGKNVITVIPNK